MTTYYKYPGDGYNWWTVIVRQPDGYFVGTRRVYPNGRLLDPMRTCFTEDDSKEWGNPISLGEAVELGKN